ncbi:Hypothetical_protein [Hexamita inflata]|uniref:Hypothetical_protein n=1 Tax=Hexamita inflata TaxID=28002 RepID=A0AA86TFA5_9EUKA|nr:Hypothetical protein HINF_LOCUS3421 [Hexamita inflata]
MSLCTGQWYKITSSPPCSVSSASKIIKQILTVELSRDASQCSTLEWNSYLYFMFCKQKFLQRVYGFNLIRTQINAREVYEFLQRVHVFDLISRQIDVREVHESLQRVHVFNLIRTQ